MNNHVGARSTHGRKRLNDIGATRNPVFQVHQRGEADTCNRADASPSETRPPVSCSESGCQTSFGYVLRELRCPCQLFFGDGMEQGQSALFRRQVCSHVSRNRSRCWNSYSVPELSICLRVRDWNLELRQMRLFKTHEAGTLSRGEPPRSASTFGTTFDQDLRAVLVVPGRERSRNIIWTDESVPKSVAFRLVASGVCAKIVPQMLRQDVSIRYTAILTDSVPAVTLLASVLRV